ncbi:MAG: hypothetical protein J6C15_02125 [Bacteroidaceae bacterium]|nr:hypothetical protein [Bacteroidaceae bacterium]
MKKSIEILLNRLEAQNITKHLVCPSANPILCDLLCYIPNVIQIIDERSACYVATGICEESNQPVVVWCADNDSYRNLTSALTEAYYKKLPILVVALSNGEKINQSINPFDTIRYYANNPIIGSQGLVNDIDRAITYLSTEVLGPVYLSLGAYKDMGLVTTAYSETIKTIDITDILDIIPSETCVHIGYGFSCKSNDKHETIYRNDHCTKDGNLSMLIGSSVVARKQLHVGIFSHDEVSYDLNMFGNRHVANNIVLFSICQEEYTSAIFDFAKRMSWDCKSVKIEDISSIQECFVLRNNPQYIEVVL